MKDMIHQVPCDSRGGAFFEEMARDEAKHQKRMGIIRTAGLLISALIFMIAGVSYILPLAHKRELYRMQVDCENKQAQGFHLASCNYWTGPRP